MKRSLHVISLVTILTAIVAAAGVAQANHSWGNYHWAPQSNPFTIKLGDNVTSSWDSYLNGASADWSASAVLDTNVVAGRAGNVRNCTPPAGRVEVCNAKYGFNGWLGVAGIWASGNHITQGYVKLNDSYFNTSSYNTPAWRRLVTCQEIGHTLGLGHTDETFTNTNQGTCMDYTNDPDGGAGGASPSDPSNEHPNAHDYDWLATIYAHADTTTTISSTEPSSGLGRGNARLPAAAAAGLDEHGLPAWASPANGDVYVTDMGNGQTLIVHVFWIQPGMPDAP